MKISVILAAYNAASYLKEALDSIVAQEYEDWEAVCIDDGSIDGTGAILDAYAEWEPRIRVFHHENKGLAVCRNEGVVLSTGNYITFCDADDRISPYWFSNAAALIAAERPDILRARLLFAKDVPRGFNDKRTSHAEQILSGQLDCLAWTWRVLFQEGFVVLTFIRAELKPFVRFSEQLILKEDSVMLVNLAPQLTRVVQSDFCGYFYRNTQGSLLRNRRDVAACVLYLDALSAIWARQRSMALQLGVLQQLKNAIRKSADNDVIEWAMMRTRDDDMPRARIEDAYSRLASAGAFSGTRYVNRRRYRLGFWLWRRTGQIWAFRLPGMVFLWLRMAINAINGRKRRSGQ